MTPPQPTTIQTLTQFLPLIVIVLVMFYMMSSSSRKDKKKKEEMMSALKKGVKVQSAGGIIGTVEEVLADEVKVVIDSRNNTTATFAKSSIATVLS